MSYDSSCRAFSFYPFLIYDWTVFPKFIECGKTFLKIVFYVGIPDTSASYVPSGGKLYKIS